ncbi:MAG: diadenylate cyclase [Anaerolineaceae bacterium]|nr:diadenylate cyclase [Anaerolineaceae bacterium]
MKVIYNDLKTEYKVVILLNEVFHQLLVALNSQYIDIQLMFALKTNASLFIYSLDKPLAQMIDSGLLCITDSELEFDEDNFDTGLYTFDPFSDTLTSILRQQKPVGYETIGIPKFIGKFDKNASAFISSLFYIGTLQNKELIEILFNKFIIEIKNSLDRVSVQKEMKFKDLIEKQNIYGIVRNTALQFLSNKFLKNNDKNQQENFYEALCLIASAPYEKEQNHGVLWNYNEAVKKNAFIKFENSIPIGKENVRQVRKLLEMSDSDNVLLIENGSVIGIYLRNSNDAGTGIEFHGNGKWNIFTHVNQSLLFFNSVTFQIKDQSFNNRLKTAIQSIFGTDCNSEKLSQIVEIAKKQSHGTTIVILKNVQQECIRLSESNRAIKLNPTEINEKNILSLTAIDGAILLDTDGFCYAIGAILDGVAEINGDTSRGSRYNSALTYVDYQMHHNNQKVLSIVISADESTDIYPG